MDRGPTGAFFSSSHSLLQHQLTASLTVSVGEHTSSRFMNVYLEYRDHGMQIRVIHDVDSKERIQFTKYKKKVDGWKINT